MLTCPPFLQVSIGMLTLQRDLQGHCKLFVFIPRAFLCRALVHSSHRHHKHHACHFSFYLGIFKLSCSSPFSINTDTKKLRSTFKATLASMPSSICKPRPPSTTASQSCHRSPSLPHVPFPFGLCCPTPHQEFHLDAQAQVRPCHFFYSFFFRN